MALARPRPAAVTVIAYLNIIFGILWGLVFLCGGTCLLVLISVWNSEAMTAKPETRLQKEMLEVMLTSLRDHIPYFVEVNVGRLVFWLVMTLVLLVSGIGLLSLKSWARTACLVYAILSIMAQLGFLIYAVAVVNPGMGRVNQDLIEWLQTHPVPGMESVTRNPGAAVGNPIAEAAGSMFGTFLFLIYPVVVLILMLLPNVKAAFQPPPLDRPPGPGADDDYFGYERPYGPGEF
jgi:hypothetical protein